MNLEIISIPDMKVPIVENRLANNTIIKVRVTLFFQNPLNVEVSSAKSSKSFTFGFLIDASTIPANQPDASRGFKDVIGAITKAVRIDSGWPRHNKTPKADKEPFQSTQDFSWASPICLLVIMV